MIRCRRQYAQRGPGHRRLSDPGKSAAGVRPVRPRQYPVHRRAVRALRRDQDHLGASRERRRLHGRRLLPRVGPADRDLHVLRAGLGEPADLARQRLSRLGAVPGGDRQRADQPVQPRRVPGTVSALSGRLSLHRALLLQEGVPADARRDGAARGPAGLEDHDDGPSGPGGARRSLRRVHGIGRRGGAEREGLERQYLQPLRRRSRRRGQGGRHAARRRAAGDAGRPGRALWRRRRGIVEARRAPADSGGGLRQRPRRASTAIIRWRSVLSRAPAIIRPITRRVRPTCCWRSACASTIAPRARGSPAIPSPFRRPSSFMSTSIRRRSAATIRSRSA